MIAGAANYANDAEIQTYARAAAAEVGDAVLRARERAAREPEPTVISAMLHAPEPLTDEEIASNVRLFVSGGLNEPRDICATAAYALLTHPDQRELTEQDPGLFEVAFEESVRWISPVGLLTRQITRDTTLGGQDLPRGSRIGLMLASANRDEEKFEDPDAFDITRGRTAHVGFNGSAHMCLGAWAARAQIGKVALPTLFDRLPGLTLQDPMAVRFSGWAFRSAAALPIRWDV